MKRRKQTARPDAHSLKFKMWRYFILFAAAIMVVLWLLQIVFLKTYYRSMKRIQVEKIGASIAQAYGTADFENTVFRLAFNNGLLVQVLDEKGSPTDDLSGGTAATPPPPDAAAFSTLLHRLAQSGGNQVSYSYDENGRNPAGGETLTFGALLHTAGGKTRYLYINAQIAPVDATATVLQTQLLIVTLLSLVLSLALSFFIASRLARPIMGINDTASKLADGDYGVRFTGGGYTEINELAATMNALARELSVTEQLRRDLLANVSHDLRTPLTMVRMYAELLRDVSGGVPEKRAAHAQIIMDEADRLNTLINDMLDLSKIQSGAAPLDCAAFDLGEKARVILIRFSGLAERDGYRFSLDHTGDTAVWADEQKIERVIYNLVGNAVNYTGADRHVSLRVERQADGVRFSVSDTGEGIPPERLEKIWERYYKAGSAHRVVGTGLGLSIVKALLEAHGAPFGVQSTPGRGSTFWFTLQPAKDHAGGQALPPRQAGRP